MSQNYDKLHARYRRVVDTLQSAARDYHVPEPALLAVSKTKPAEMVRAIYNLGQRDFGENYLQDALPKIEALHDLNGIKWHFVGQIQSNKTALIAQHFDWVHSVYRLKIASRLNNQRPAYFPKLKICIQVNLDDEPQKGGIAPNELLALAEAINQLERLELEGLMCIPKPRTSHEEQRQVYEQLRTLLTQTNQRLNLSMKTLSMGMSNDILPAIQAGSTMVRVGSDIFGERA